MTRHTTRRTGSGDYTCSCGATWDYDEGVQCPSAGQFTKGYSTVPNTLIEPPITRGSDLRINDQPTGLIEYGFDTVPVPRNLLRELIEPLSPDSEAHRRARSILEGK